MSENPLLDVPGAENSPLPSAVAISALAMNFALKWHDMTLIKDGVMYQQKRMEGANLTVIDFPDVLETAAKFERHLLTADERFAKIVCEMFDAEPSE